MTFGWFRLRFKVIFSFFLGLESKDSPPNASTSGLPGHVTARGIEICTDVCCAPCMTPSVLPFRKKHNHSPDNGCLSKCTYTALRIFCFRETRPDTSSHRLAQTTYRHVVQFVQKNRFCSRKVIPLFLPEALWVDEILQRLGWTKPHRYWNKPPTNWCRILAVHSTLSLTRQNDNPFLSIAKHCPDTQCVLVCPFHVFLFGRGVPSRSNPIPAINS